MIRIASIAAVAAALILAASAASALSPFILFFDAGSARLSAHSLAILDNAARAIETLDARRIELVGHSDRVGSRRANLALSRRRAEAVKAALVERGVPAERLIVTALGEDRPLLETADDVAEPQNRRVELVMLVICRSPPHFDHVQNCPDGQVPRL